MLIDGLVHLPLVLPPVVMGYLLLITLGTRAPVGAWLLDTFGIRLVFNWTGAAVAAGIVTFPFQVRAMRLALEGVDSGLEAAARSLGASRLDVFCSVTLPLMSPGIIVGAITAFAASLGEFGAIITFVSNVPGETQTLPLAIYWRFRRRATRRRRRGWRPCRSCWRSPACCSRSWPAVVPGA